MNEGLIEWPPSPWRLLRAFIASGFNTQHWTDVPPAAQELLNKLASVLPSYRLPMATAAHSRHYMPFIEGKAQKTTLVFDTWANVGDGELLVYWPCDLSDAETSLLSRLAGSLGYLGRSESWVEGELIEDVPTEWDAEPCQTGERRGQGWEQVSLFGAIPSSEYESWRSTQAQLVERGFEGQKQTAALKKKIAKLLVPYPKDLLSCLQLDTSQWKQYGWSQPPGSQRVLYWRRNDSLQLVAPRNVVATPYSRVTTMLLAITTTSGNRSALPPVTRTLPQAELFHRSIVSRLGQGQRVYCPELTGKDENNQPLQGAHEHSHCIPVDLDGDGRIDHIIVHANMGLGDLAQRAIRSLRRTWTKKETDELQVAFVGAGDIATLRGLPAPMNQQLLTMLGPPEGSRVWRSATPFVFPRFLKSSGRNSALGQVNAELSSRSLPEAIDVIIDKDLSIDLRHFVRRRNHGGNQAPVDAGFGLQITFEESLSLNAPLTLGYAAHFGLGLFESAEEAD